MPNTNGKRSRRPSKKKIEADETASKKMGVDEPEPKKQKLSERLQNEQATAALPPQHELPTASESKRTRPADSKSKWRLFFKETSTESVWRCLISPEIFRKGKVIFNTTNVVSFICCNPQQFKCSIFFALFKISKRQRYIYY